MASTSVMNCPNYYDEDAYESAYVALRGVDSIALVVQHDVVQPDGGHLWASHVLDELITAQRVLLHHAEAELDRLRRESWSAKARLGEFGPEARKRAESRVGSECG